MELGKVDLILKRLHLRACYVSVEQLLSGTIAIGHRKPRVGERMRVLSRSVCCPFGCYSAAVFLLRRIRKTAPLTARCRDCSFSRAYCFHRSCSRRNHRGKLSLWGCGLPQQNRVWEFFFCIKLVVYWNVEQRSCVSGRADIKKKITFVLLQWRKAASEKMGNLMTCVDIW